ncbi:MAG: Periplasmic component of the Tol biopolymer transport system [Pedosphaera sp.]|nr:Periplasmic component of the Tol biopolymer transport system [Pedosphaera sp.]
MRTQRLRLAFSLAFLTFSGFQAFAQEVGRDATRSLVTVFNVDGKSTRVVFESDRRFDAPSWSADGSYLILNSGGKLWRVPVNGTQEPRKIPTGSAGWIDIDHGTSPDGKTLAFTSGPISVLPVSGGTPRRVTPRSPSYFHGWSPDGKTLIYTADRGRGYKIFAIDIAGGAERPLAPDQSSSDSPSYSPDGAWIYFHSPDAGTSEIWRVPSMGDAANAERVLGDDREDCVPHPSPDGKWLFYLSYPRNTQGHPSDRDVIIRRIPLPGAKIAPAKIEDVVRFVGGHGSIGSRPWSPDGRQFAYVSYEPPPPTVRIVLFTPSNLKAPAGARKRLTQIADSAEKFLFGGMKRWGYSPVAKSLFRRESDGSVEVLQVRGDRPVWSGRYANPNYAEDVIQRASQKYRVAGEGHIWWIFIYLGDRPTRFNDWRGFGNSRDGGWAMVNYDTIPGEIRSDAGLEEGFNAQYFLKGTIHELGHAFGLPHIGPDLALGLGNSLMGPNNSVYADRKYPKADQVYLTESSAAMLWKHPVFSGTARDRILQPSAKLVDYQPKFSLADDRVTLSGKLIADQRAHTVVVIDDQGRPFYDNYWFQSHAARIAPDGTFQVTIDKPAKTNGCYRILFCFENGMVTGDGKGGNIQKSYVFHDGIFQFGD